ncbi:5'-nucleotidase domain-containing protein 1 [Monomorium pharaonis]|uniref:5'-nucleotidase domain-containing protein 1 n=1 Tax=Monomorium pharaonis TaxID=307658 RepID=UPI00063F8A88|nr:5'-nucleotidase domain-containing protein 1 [Monomorium pharaonis]
MIRNLLLRDTVKDVGLHYRIVRSYTRGHSVHKKHVTTGKSEVPPDSIVRTISNSGHDLTTFSRSDIARNDMDGSSFKFTDYDCIGFDLDNTLLRYNVTNLVHMEYEILARFLVDKRGYSGKRLLAPLTDDDLDFLQKGLLLDLERGNVLRVSPDGVIRRACHGSRLLNVEQIREIYPEQRWEATDAFCRDSLETWNGPLSEKVRGLLDYFDIVTSIAFARVVDTLDEEHGSPLDKYDSWIDIKDGLVYMFIKEHFDTGEGIFGYIKKNPEKYLRKCSTDTISWLREVKKKAVTFLITGSHVNFANFTASYALGEDWRSLFDIVVCYARKPGFFSSNRSFFDIENNNETNVASRELKRGEIYSQGNWNDLLKFFARITGKTNQRCVYIGDNLIQDIYAPSAFTRCDTVAVIEELTSEGMLHHASTHPDEKILNSKLWGSYFCLKDSTINEDSLWGNMIKKYAKLCIPDISLITQRPLHEPIPCFDKDGKLYRGYHPAVPLSISAM